MRFVKVGAEPGLRGFWVDASAYLAELPKLVGQLPEGAREFVLDALHYDFSSPRCVKGLELAGASMGTKEGSDLRVRFESNHEAGLVVTYSRVRRLVMDVGEGGTGFREFGTLLLDEVLPLEGSKNLVHITVDSAGPRPYWTTNSEPVHLDNKIRKTAHAKTAALLATDVHPFWVAGDLNRWVDATDLRPGMWIRTSAGTYAQVTAIKRWSSQGQRVHNLSIADRHTYYVLAGETPVLVHNDICHMDDIGSPSDQLVLGSRADTLMYATTPGLLVLNDPAWNVAGNMEWIRRAAAGRRTFRLVTPLGRDSLWSTSGAHLKVYRLEITELLNQGYRFSPDRKFMLPPP